jgi:hypothetical protein
MLHDKFPHFPLPLLSLGSVKLVFYHKLLQFPLPLLFYSFSYNPCYTRSSFLPIPEVMFADFSPEIITLSRKCLPFLRNSCNKCTHWIHKGKVDSSFCVISEISEHILVKFIILFYIKIVYFMSVWRNKDLRS